MSDERRRRGNVLVTPAIQMTAASSGSSGITVADSAEYDLAASDFGVLWKGSRTTWRPAAPEEIAVTYQDATNYVSLICNAAGTLRLLAVVAGVTIIDKTSSAAVPESYANRIISLAFAVVREASSVAGSFTPYMDGAALGASQAITAASATSLSNTGALYIAGTSAARYASNTVSFILTNFAPTAAQVSTLYSSGIPDAWKWGSNIAQTSGLLTVGKNYRVNTYANGDDFRNVGGVPDNYGLLNGTATNFFSTPDSAAASITGDIRIRVLVAMTDWTSATDETFVSKYNGTGNQRSYLLRNNGASGGNISLIWTVDGVNAIVKNATVAPTVTDGEYLWVEAYLDVDNGSAGNTVTFRTSTDIEEPDPDAVTGWAQLGDPVVTAGVTSIFDGTADTIVGHAPGATSPLNGRVKRAAIYSGVGATIKAADFNPTSYTGTSPFTSTTGEAWTINGTASIVVRYPDIFTATGTTPTTWANLSSLVQTGTTLALLPETLPTSGALAWPDSSTNANDATLPAAGATKVTIRA